MQIGLLGASPLFSFTNPGLHAEVDPVNSNNFKPQLDELIELGYTKISFESSEQIIQLKEAIKLFTSEHAHKNISLIDDVHLAIKNEHINDYRLNIIKLVNRSDFKTKFIETVTPFFRSILGEDLAYQKNLNLVLVPPQDQSSILPIHADTWTGNSKFELTMLFALTPIIPSQNMFILPLPAWKKYQSELAAEKSLQSITKKLHNDFHFLDLKAGEAFVFWHNLPHGSMLNESSQTHWSINLRAKNIFTPYMEKGLGDYFQPYELSRFNEFVFKETTHEPKNSRLHN